MCYALSILKWIQKLGICQEGRANFFFWNEQLCSRTKRERREKICCGADNGKNQFLSSFRYIVCLFFFYIQPIFTDSTETYQYCNHHPHHPDCPFFDKQAQEESPLLHSLQGIVIVGNQIEYSKELVLINKERILWTDLDIPGNPNKLRDQLTPFLKQLITPEILTKIKQTIANYFIQQDHPFILVQIPEQDITTGVVQINLTHSRVGEIKVEGNRWVSSKQLKNYIKLRPEDPIDQSRLIENISFINRNPFRRADLVFELGKETDTTDVIIATKDRFPLRVYSGTDNTGVEPIGQCRWYAGFNWGNAFGLDHILSYQFTSSYSMHRFQAHTAQYIAPLSWGHLLNIYGGYSEVHPRGHIIRNSGWSMQTSGRYVVPLKIYQYLEHEITAGGDLKRSNNTFEFSEDFPTFGNTVNLTQLALEYSGNYERNQFRIDFDGAFYWSPGRWISDQTNADFSSLRPGAVNHWVYFRGCLRYLQRLPYSFSLSLLAEGQVSSEPLLPSEQFGLGGYDSVRGYEEREVNKDDAILLSLEARSPALPISKWIKPSSKITDALQFLAFIDYGWGLNIDTIPSTHKCDYLIGIGPGLRYTLEPYLTGRLDWGVRLHNAARFEGHWNRVHFSLTASY